MLLSQEIQVSNVAGPADVFYFGGFQLQPDEQRLLHHGVPVTLQTRALDVLTLLVSHPGRLITRADLLRRVWRGLVVEDNNLNVQISALRKVLGKSAIATVPGKGYRFNWPVRCEPWPRPADTPSLQVPKHPQSSATVPVATWSTGSDGSPASVLLGRLAEVTQLLHQLRHVPWVSVVGPPGAGKSRLAQVAAWRHAAAAGVPVAWVDLTPMSALQDVALAVSVALHLPLAQEPDKLWWTLRQQLGQVSALLVLDNADRLPAELGAVVAGWLVCAPALRVMVTRQRPLHQRGELVFRIEGLALPPGHISACPPDDSGNADTDMAALDAALAVPSVALLVQQIQLADPRFTPQAVDLPALCAVVQALDGWPLALELAAARVPALGLAALPALMSERLNLLTATALSTSPNTRSGTPGAAAPFAQMPGSPAPASSALRGLRCAIEASHARLTPRQQRLFRRLAVFEGDASLDLIQQVVSDPLPAVDAAGVPLCHGLCAALTQPDPTDALWLDDAIVALELAALADASVSYMGTAVAGDETSPRIGLWQNMRALALELAVASGELAALHHAHTAAVSRRARAWLEARALGQLSHQRLVERGQREQRHLQQAWRWRDDRQSPDDMLVLVHALWLATEGSDGASQAAGLRLLERRAPCALSLRLWADVCLPPAGTPDAWLGGTPNSTLLGATQAYVALARVNARANADGTAKQDALVRRNLHHALCARVVALCRSGDVELARPLWFEAHRLCSSDWPALDLLASCVADMAMHQALYLLDAAESPEPRDCPQALAEATQRLLMHAHEAGCHWLVGALHCLDSLVVMQSWPQASTLAYRVSQQVEELRPSMWAGRLHLACAATWLGAGRLGAARQALRRAWSAHQHAGLTVREQPGLGLHAWLALLDQRRDDVTLWLGLAPLPPRSAHPAQRALAGAGFTREELAAGCRAGRTADDRQLADRALHFLQVVN